MAPQVPPAPTPTDAHPHASMESTRLCHLQECRSDSPDAREQFTASQHHLGTRSEDAGLVAIDDVEVHIGHVNRHRINRAHDEQWLIAEARPLIPLGYVITVGSPRGSDLRYQNLSDKQSLAQCVLIGEKKVVLGQFALWNACSH